MLIMNKRQYLTKAYKIKWDSVKFKSLSVLLPEQTYTCPKSSRTKMWCRLLYSAGDTEYFLFWNREVAVRAAHSLETDLWSLGCVFYTLLVGKPPFDTEGAHPTLKKVVIGEYELPSHVSENAQNLIQVITYLEYSRVEWISLVSRLEVSK